MRYLFLQSIYSISSVALLISASFCQADMGDISRIYHSTPSLAHLEICYGGGCSEHQISTLSTDDWQNVVSAFQQAHSPPEERFAISQAIGMLEYIIGHKIGTATDRAGTFNNSQYKKQLDCNDEAINSTTYMRLMQQDGLIKLHEVEDMRTRAFFFNAWPHSTAVIREIQSQERFAVDSWFYDNGAPATIVPFALWKSGYVPEDSPLGQPRAAVKIIPAKNKHTLANSASSVTP